MVNFANIGATFGTQVLKRTEDLFDWDGVRRAVRHLTEAKKLKVVGVILKDFKARDFCPRQSGHSQKRVSVPPDVRDLCDELLEVPRGGKGKYQSIDDEWLRPDFFRFHPRRKRHFLIFFETRAKDDPCSFSPQMLLPRQ